MTQPKFPLSVSRGSVTVKIYRTSKTPAEFKVAYYDATGARKLKSFADLGEAREEAASLAVSMSRGELDVLTLTNLDRSAYVRALEVLKPSGASLVAAAEAYAEAVKIIEGAPLLEAARFYAKHHSKKFPVRSVADLVEEFILVKAKDGASEVYLKDLRFRLRRLAHDFHCPVAMLTGQRLDEWLRAMNLSGRSKNNYRLTLSTLFSYCKGRYLPKDWAEMDLVAVAKEDATKIDIFTPAEMAVFLEYARAKKPHLVPFLAIGAFAGVRHAEMQRLRWEDINFETGFITISADDAKTAARRLIPISPNLRAWLKPHLQPEGPVTTHVNMTDEISDLAKGVAVAYKEKEISNPPKWKHNALRHSFISYRVAQTQDVAKVALEAGNSPRKIFSNYRELVRPSEAEAWFCVVPV